MEEYIVHDAAIVQQFLRTTVHTNGYSIFFLSVSLTRLEWNIITFGSSQVCHVPAVCVLDNWWTLGRTTKREKRLVVAHCVASVATGSIRSMLKVKFEAIFFFFILSHLLLLLAVTWRSFDESFLFLNCWKKKGFFDRIRCFAVKEESDWNIQMVF